MADAIVTGNVKTVSSSGSTTPAVTVTSSVTQGLSLIGEVLVGVPVATEGGGTVNAEWGDIDGTLADQIDLQTALDAKATTSALTTGLATKANTSHTHTESQISDLGDYVTQTDVDTSIAAVIDTAPTALNTLNELAAALGDDANFASTVTTSLAA